MDEKLIAKVRAVLESLGEEEDKIEAVVEALENEDAPVESGEGKSEEETTSNEPPVEEEPVADDVPLPEGEGEVPVPQEEPVIADPESVPPAELPPELPSELPPEVPPVEQAGPEGLPPVGPELPPMVDLEEFNKVVTRLEETEKANQGLQARIESLEEALKGAGIIDGAVGNEVGNDIPSAPSAVADDTTIDDVLREINMKRY